MNKMKFETPNLTAENSEKLAAKISELFPGVVTEGKVNIDLLRIMLGEEVFGDEAYEFTWVGKRAAIAEAGRPIRKTLRPCVEESKDWDTTENLYIEGDNLDVLKLLQESYLGKVKMIYIDPPYNTGSDFIYRDDFKQSREEYEEETGEYDEDGDRLFRNTETNGRFHSDWCSMIYPRLVLARNMLRDDGVVFVSIDDHEVENLKKMCDEVFGESNFVAQLIWQQRKGGGNDSRLIAVDHEYVVVYSKSNLSNTKWRIKHADEYLKRYKEVDDIGRYYWDTLSRDGLQNPIPVTIIAPDGEKVFINSQRSQASVESGLKDGSIRLTQTTNGWSLHRKVYMPDGQVLRSLLLDVGNNRNAGNELKEIFSDIYFDYAKPIGLVKVLCSLCTKENDSILDFFSGSATTAHAVMQLNAEDGGNRKFIMVQLPEVCADGTKAAKAGYKNICEIGKERIRRAGDKIKAESGLMAQNLDIGFRVLKLDDTNMNDVYYAAGDYTQDLILQMESNIKPDRTDMDLLCACLLDWGLPLSMPHTHEKIDGFTVHTYNDGDLIACFEERIREKVIREIASRKPLRAVFRDSSFSSSPEKINVFETFKLLAPNTNVRVI